MYPQQTHSKNHRASDADRGSQIDTWAIEQSIDRGYAVATFYNGDVDPDRPDVRAGIQPHLRDKDHKPGLHDWGTIAAWAGVCSASSIMSSQTKTSIRSASLSSATPAWARPPSSRPRLTNASPWPSR